MQASRQAPASDFRRAGQQPDGSGSLAIEQYGGRRERLELVVARALAASAQAAHRAQTGCARSVRGVACLITTNCPRSLPPGFCSMGGARTDPLRRGQPPSAVVLVLALTHSLEPHDHPLLSRSAAPRRSQ